MHRITITRPADFATAAAAVLGFEPAESLVVLGVSRGGFTARVDHPHTNDDLLAVAAEFGTAFRRNPGQRVVLICFTDHVEHALDAVTAVTAMSDGLAEVVTALRIHGNDVYDVPTGRLLDHITPAMRTASAAALVAAGRPVGHSSRDAKQEALFAAQPQPAAENFEASTEALAAVAADTHRLADEVRWVVETVRIHALTGLRVGDEDAARLIVNAGHPTLMEALIAQIDRDSAEGHATLWTDLTNRAPAEHITGPALAAAFAHWQTGDGAAAWMAYDRAQAPATRSLASVVLTPSGNSLASLIKSVLSEAINPTEWLSAPQVREMRKKYRPDA